MKIITLTKTKELLGITDSSLDTKISRYIPIIDSKVKQITNNKYNMQIIGDTIYNSNIVKITGITNSTGGINNSFEIDGAINYLKFGDMISGTNIPANSYIDDIYMANNITPTIELSETATATGTDILITVGFNIGLQTTVAKGIYWLISQENTDIEELGWTSQRIGSVSVVRGVEQAKVDGR
ncbi:MAG: hypothetical protein U9Q40_05600, partial [Campylobacterota bacterium]|nr:hypothetical protein [Campylobacterota bacterium]